MFLDEYAHYCVSCLSSYKSHVFKMFKDFIAKSEARINPKTIKLYYDKNKVIFDKWDEELLY